MKTSKSHSEINWPLVSLSFSLLALNPQLKSYFLTRDGPLHQASSSLFSLYRSHLAPQSGGHHFCCNKLFEGNIFWPVLAARLMRLAMPLAVLGGYVNRKKLKQIGAGYYLDKWKEQKALIFFNKCKEWNIRIFKRLFY